MAGLSDAKIRAAKATGKAYKLSDGQQLYLHVSAAGGRSWRMNYQFGRNDAGNLVQKTLTIGTYPAITLAQAREARDMAKGFWRGGSSPSRMICLIGRKRLQMIVRISRLWRGHGTNCR